MTLKDLKNKEQARQYAVDWQLNFQNKEYSYADLIDWQNTFVYLGKKYGLTEEYQENGII